MRSALCLCLGRAAGRARGLYMWSARRLSSVVEVSCSLSCAVCFLDPSLLSIFVIHPRVDHLLTTSRSLVVDLSFIVRSLFVRMPSTLFVRSCVGGVWFVCPPVAHVLFTCAGMLFGFSGCFEGGRGTTPHKVHGIALSEVWAQADAVLEVVGEVISRQQRELATLSRNLGIGMPPDVSPAALCDAGASLQTLDEDVGATPFVDARPPCDMGDERWRHGQHGDEAVAEEPQRQFSEDLGECVGKNSDSAPHAQAEEDAESDARVAGPWFALDHLSVALSSLDVALQRADLDRSLRSSCSRGSLHGSAIFCTPGSSSAKATLSAEPASASAEEPFVDLPS